MGEKREFPKEPGLLPPLASLPPGSDNWLEEGCRRARRRNARGGKSAMFNVLVTLHGPEAESGTVSRCCVDALTVTKIRAAYPFAGRFIFRVKRADGSGADHLWWDLLGNPDEPFAVDDPRSVELRALCVDPDDETWDGPVAAGAKRPPAAAAADAAEAVRERVGATMNAAKERAAELQDKFNTNETVQRAQSKAKEIQDKLNSHRRNVTGKLSQWLDG